MTLGCKVDNVVEIVLVEKVFDQLRIADVASVEKTTLVINVIRNSVKIASIGKRIENDDANVVVGFQQMFDVIGADKTCCAGNEIRFHVRIRIKKNQNVVRNALSNAPHASDSACMEGKSKWDPASVKT